MILDTLITDRSQEDVDLVKLLCQDGVGNMGEYETAFRNGTLKGSYDWTDWNRVEEAVEYVANALVQAQQDLEDYADSIGVDWDSYYNMPYDPNTYSSIVVKKNWAKGDLPSNTQMTRYYNNIVLIKNALDTASPIPPGMDNLTFEGANQLEALLIQAYGDMLLKVEEKKSYINSTADAFRSGEIYSGEEES